MNITKVREEILLGKSIYDMKLNVADYGRVSTDKDEQVNSLENQVNYFSDFINGVKNWNHINSYIDEGISGTQVYKRDQFLKMIDDARLGKIDLILTKEVSRFARNTIDSIKYTEILLNYGVAVFFISDNINTIYKDSEFRLTLMASMAQDEVRKISERVKFGIKRSIKDGKVLGGGIYGYNKNNSKLTVIEEEAKVIRMIYKMYSKGEYGLKKIGEILARDGYFTRKGNVFSDMTLKKIIKNPRYKGWYTANLSEVEDYKTHKRIFKEEKDWIIYKDESGRIPKIVSEKLWDKANDVLNERNKKIIKNNNSIYTSKLICFEHNKSFIRSSSCKRKNNPVWQCNEYLRHGIKGCSTPIIEEKKLDNLFTKIIDDILINKDKLMEEIINDYKCILNESNISLELKNKIEKNKSLKENLLDLLLRKIITENEYYNKNNKINIEIEKLKKILNKEQDSISNLEKIKNEIVNLFDIKNNLNIFLNIFIKKIFVKKINNNRNKINIQIVFNYDKEDMFIDLDLSDY